MNKPIQSWLTPAVCIGDVMHARTRPIRNVFHYPIFYLRLPLSRQNQLNIRGLAVNRKGICQILNRDHGPRDGTSLLNWVEGLLAEHQLADVTAGGEVVLQTMPRLAAGSLACSRGRARPWPSSKWCSAWVG